MTTEGVWVAQRSDPVVQFFPQPDGHLRPRGQQGQYTQLCLYHSAMYIHLRGRSFYIDWVQAVTTCSRLAGGLRGNGKRVRTWRGNGERMRKSDRERFPPSLFPLLFYISSFPFISLQFSAFVASVRKILRRVYWAQTLLTQRLPSL